MGLIKLLGSHLHHKISIKDSKSMPAFSPPCKGSPPTLIFSNDILPGQLLMSEIIESIVCKTNYKFGDSCSLKAAFFSNENATNSVGHAFGATRLG